ncbi:MAG: cobalt-precorrin-6A reductase [Pseudomonadota bacterium]
MQANLLILGGTTEATALCKALAERGFSGVVSFAGRVERPRRQPLPQRMGGFGGVDGLRTYLRDHAVTHVIDATHPFAAQMSFNAVAACDAESVPLVALTRAPWSPVDGDNWTRVPNTAEAVAALARPARNVMLAVGRQTLAAFAPNQQHRYLLRLVDPPENPPPFERYDVSVSRGPFTVEGDRALLQQHKIELIVSKNSGGAGAYAKILAARELGLPVIMIDRPAQPPRHELYTVADVLAWLSHPGTERGV